MGSKREPSLFHRKLRSLKNARAELLAARVQVDMFDAAIRTLEPKFFNFINGEESRYYTTVYLHALTSGSDAAPFLRALAQAGYRQAKPPVQDLNDLCVKWVLTNDAKHDVRVNGYLDQEKISCKKVLVRMETKEVGVYETRCEGPGTEQFASVASALEEAPPT